MELHKICIFSIPKKDFETFNSYIMDLENKYINGEDVFQWIHIKMLLGTCIFYENIEMMEFLSEFLYKYKINPDKEKILDHVYFAYCRNQTLIFHHNIETFYKNFGDKYSEIYDSIINQRKVII